MQMTKFDNTTFFKATDQQKLLLALERIFSLDRYMLCEEVPAIDASQAEQMLSGPPQTTRHWGVALIPTELDWTVIKTCPFNLLGEYPSGFLQPRLQILSHLMRRPGLLTVVEQGVWTFTLETNEAGSCGLGGTLSEASSLYELELPEFQSLNADPAYPSITVFKDMRQTFQLTPALNDLLTTVPYPDFVDIENFGLRLTGRPIEEWDNLVQIDHLMTGIPLDVPGSRVAYFQRHD